MGTHKMREAEEQDPSVMNNMENEDAEHTLYYDEYLFNHLNDPLVQRRCTTTKSYCMH